MTSIPSVSNSVIKRQAVNFQADQTAQNTNTTTETTNSGGGSAKKIVIGGGLLAVAALGIAFRKNIGKFLGIIEKEAAKTAENIKSKKVGKKTTKKTKKQVKVKRQTTTKTKAVKDNAKPASTTTMKLRVKPKSNKVIEKTRTAAKALRAKAPAKKASVAKAPAVKAPKVKAPHVELPKVDLSGRVLGEAVEEPARDPLATKVYRLYHKAQRGIAKSFDDFASDSLSAAKHYFSAIADKAFPGLDSFRHLGQITKAEGKVETEKQIANRLIKQETALAKAKAAKAEAKAKAKAAKAEAAEAAKAEEPEKKTFGERLSALATDGLNSIKGSKTYRNLAARYRLMRIKASKAHADAAPAEALANTPIDDKIDPVMRAAANVARAKALRANTIGAGASASQSKFSAFFNKGIEKFGIEMPNFKDNAIYRGAATGLKFLGRFLPKGASVADKAKQAEENLNPLRSAINNALKAKAKAKESVLQEHFEPNLAQAEEIPATEALKPDVKQGIEVKMSDGNGGYKTVIFDGEGVEKISRFKSLRSRAAYLYNDAVRKIRDIRNFRQQTADIRTGHKIEDLPSGYTATTEKPEVADNSLDAAKYSLSALGDRLSGFVPKKINISDTMTALESRVKSLLPKEIPGRKLFSRFIKSKNETSAVIEETAQTKDSIGNINMNGIVGSNGRIYTKPEVVHNPSPALDEINVKAKYKPIDIGSESITPSAVTKQADTQPKSAAVGNQETSRAPLHEPSIKEILADITNMLAKDKAAQAEAAGNA